MASAPLSVPDQIRQLEDARKLVLKDVSYYKQVIQATLPIVGPSAQLEFRRWGSDFLAEAFATPALPVQTKELHVLMVIDTLKQLVEDPNQDVLVLRSVIQAAASIYPLAMRWTINNSYDSVTWECMTAIKKRIRDIWDTSPLTVRICCIKFAQRLVLAHTPSAHPETRRGSPLDISLDMVTPNHAILDGDSLEAEGSAYLDRMLSVLEDESSDPLLVDATLNTLSILVRARPKTSGRIVSCIFNFNPLRLANSHPLPPKTKVLVRSMEKTTRMLLIHLSRRDPNNPLAGRMQQYVERLMRSRAEIFDESRKRPMVEPAAVVEAKRQRTAAATTSAQPQIEITPLKPGANTLAEVFTFTTNEGLQKFSVSDTIPAPIAAKISVRTIAQLDEQILERAINGVRERLAVLHQAGQKAANPETAPLDVEDDDDYEPDYHTAEDSEQLLNKLDSSPTEDRRELQPSALGALTLPSFKLPAPPRLNPEQASKVSQAIVARVFDTAKSLEDPATKKTKAGMNRLAASSYDRESWITVISRLATRTSAGLDNVTVKAEDSALYMPQVNMSDTIRETLYNYILEDFRKRIDIAISWLSEEWYKEQVQTRFASTPDQTREAPANFEKWAVRLIDAFFPYLHGQDRVLTRFLGELPQLTASIFARVKTLCRDPTLVNLALTSLFYLVMFRPPVRELALDTIQDIWTDYDDARPVAAKYLQRWRPGFVEAQQQQAAGNGTPSEANGTAAAVN
ncbi:mRNA cleavage and polyadenylation specificity factor complex subunit [Xylariaceae sp. FL1019]|nr:mRNA cleavage and polyadenylation specificity factor complex subunit [Xylariaceae sp. FL1019]